MKDKQRWTAKLHRFVFSLSTYIWSVTQYAEWRLFVVIEERGREKEREREREEREREREGDKEREKGEKK